MKGLNKISLCFAAGCIGGLLSALLLYLFGALGVMSAYGVKWLPVLSPDWIYQKVVWGGLFGLFFALPLLDKAMWVISGVVYSAVPTLAQLFIFFPLITNEGTLGVGLGANTLYFVVFFNLAWGLITAFWLRLAR